MAPYANKRNRFIHKVKDYLASNPEADASKFTRPILTGIANGIGMKHMPTWVAKEHKSGEFFDLSGLVGNVPSANPQNI